jgi:hypothetical protein
LNELIADGIETLRSRDKISVIGAAARIPGTYELDGIA